MALTNEDLLAISQLLDSKLEPIKNDIRDTKITQENDILPRLQNIESMQADIDIMKKVLTEHSEKLNRIA